MRIFLSMLIFTNFFLSNDLYAGKEDAVKPYLPYTKKPEDETYACVESDPLLKKCSEYFSKLKAREDWQPHLFSDPTKHNNDKFIYLVHAFNSAHYRVKSDFLENIQTHLPKMFLSTSLITEDHTATWGDCGVILDFHPSQIYLTHHDDFGLENSAPTLGLDSFMKYLCDIFSKVKIQSPNSLLQSTASHQYNEVGLLGTSPDGNQVKAKAFYIKIPTNRYNCTEVMQKEIRAEAKSLGLPVVEIDLEKIDRMQREKAEKERQRPSEGEEEDQAVTFLRNIDQIIGKYQGETLGEELTEEEQGLYQMMEAQFYAMNPNSKKDEKQKEAAILEIIQKFKEHLMTSQ